MCGPNVPSKTVLIGWLRGGYSYTREDLTDFRWELDRFTHSILATDSMEVKPIMTRKLRRRPNDPVPIPDKRRKPAPDIRLCQALITFFLRLLESFAYPFDRICMAIVLQTLLYLIGKHM